MNITEFRPKQSRPFSNKKSLHVVLRSRTAVLRTDKNRKLVAILLSQYADKFNIRVYQNSLNSSHLHLVLLVKGKKELQSFLRVFAGQLAQRITGAVKGRGLTKSFWMSVAWSRVVEWGRAFHGVINYIFKNQMESLGILAYQPRGRRVLRV